MRFKANLAAIGIMLVSVAAGCSHAAPVAADNPNQAAQAKAFEGIARASIDTTGGMPRMLINGKPELPIIFWFNIARAENYIERYQDPQVKMARDAGIHIYGLLIEFPRAADGINIDFSAAEKILDSFIRVDPQATFFLRALPYPSPQWADWKDVPRDEMMIYDDGTTPAQQISLASDYFERSFRAETERIVSHFENSPYAKRMLGYHLGGPEFEMFALLGTEKGPDLAPANHRRFRTWLAQKYPTEAALRTAWGDPALTFETASIPRPEAGRFPMTGTDDGSPIRVFYNLPQEQAWVDYSAYFSDLVATRVIDWAEAVKRASGGKRLSMFCEGYIFDIGGSYSGHYALEKVLAAPAIDVLMSPLSYGARQIGEPAGIMSAVDSIAAHGKLWLNEDDMRTAFIDTSALPPGLLSSIAFDQMAKDLHDTQAMLERNLGMTFAHRCGIWWCDLVGTGTFNHPALWEMLRERMQLYAKIYAKPAPFRPEVAIVVDEASRFSIRSDWDWSAWALTGLRNECNTSGASVGFYMIQDFINGLMPPCKVYIFPNAFALSDNQIAAIRERLERECATALWSYAPGFLGPNGPDAQRIAQLTGIDVKVTTGTTGSEGLGLLAGEHLGAIFPGSEKPLNFAPRFEVTDTSATALGRYTTDGAISVAEKQVNGFRSIYSAEIGLTYRVLDRLFESAGVHLWTNDHSVTVADASFLMIHSATAGQKAIRIPKGIKATPLNVKIARREGDTIYVDCILGDTLWFELERE